MCRQESKSWRSASRGEVGEGSIAKKAMCVSTSRGTRSKCEGMI